MKIWAQIHKGEKMITSYLYEVKEKFNIENFEQYLTEICELLDIPRPITLRSHLKHFSEFNNAIYKPIDFIESVDFNKFVLEAVADDE